VVVRLGEAWLCCRFYSRWDRDMRYSLALSGGKTGYSGLQGLLDWCLSELVRMSRFRAGAGSIGMKFINSVDRPIASSNTQQASQTK
jgi:hypothetical protein